MARITVELVRSLKKKYKNNAVKICAILINVKYGLESLFILLAKF